MWLPQRHFSPAGRHKSNTSSGPPLTERRSRASSLREHTEFPLPNLPGSHADYINIKMEEWKKQVKCIRSEEQTFIHVFGMCISFEMLFALRVSLSQKAVIARTPYQSAVAEHSLSAVSRRPLPQSLAEDREGAV